MVNVRTRIRFKFKWGIFSQRTPGETPDATGFKADPVFLLIFPLEDTGGLKIVYLTPQKSNRIRYWQKEKPVGDQSSNHSCSVFATKNCIRVEPLK